MFLPCLLPAFFGPVSAVAQSIVIPGKSEYTLLAPTPRDSMRELNADRPDKTDCPFTVDAGHFQIEADFADFTYDAANSVHLKSVTYRIAPMNIKVGLLNNMDLQFVFTPWQLEDSWTPGKGAAQQNSGFDGITPRVKINLLGNDGGFFAVALIPFITIPVVSGESGAIEGGIGIPYAFDIPGWDVGLQTTLYTNHDEVAGKNSSEISNSVSVGRAIFGPISYSAELFSACNIEHGADWIWTTDTWLTYEADENMRIDGGVYIGLTPSSDLLQPWVGMTWRQ